MNFDDTPQNARKLIRFFEKKIEAGESDAKVIAVMRRHLDTIIDKHQSSPEYGQHYNAILELQALVYLQEGNAEAGQEVLRKAMSRAGGQDKLYSDVLQEYAAKHRKQLRMMDFSKLSEQEREYLASYKLSEASDIRFFTRSPAIFVLLEILTLGTYSSVWYFRNWRVIRDAGGASISPFWRTFFAIFWLWPIFKVIRAYPKANGSDKDLKAGALATAYIVIGLGGGAVSGFLIGSYWYWVLLIAAQLVCLGILLYAQSVAVDSNAKRHHDGWSAWKKGEFIFIVLAVLMAVGNVANVIVGQRDGTLVPLSKFGEQIEYQTLQAQYEVCNEALQPLKDAVDKQQGDKAAVEAYDAKATECNDLAKQRDAAADELGIKPVRD